MLRSFGRLRTGRLSTNGQVIDSPFTLSLSKGEHEAFNEFGNSLCRQAGDP
jgi:hypothetical protein